MSSGADIPSGGDAHERLKVLGKYQIHRRLGAGGMGAVFLATDTDLKRTVALKVLPHERAENPTLVRRFKSEAQAVAQLRHDNIVAIYEAGEIDGFPYLALEYIEGTDVLSLIQKRGVLPPRRSLKIIRQVAEALSHAWHKSIVHRDIKPANLLIQADGAVKLTDLGLARSMDETLDTSITRAGTTVGTVDYISPEQACDSRAADIRSDIYSLGCTWYHMLVGTPPYPDGDLRMKLQGHISRPIPDPRAFNPNVPEAYVAVMHRMMAKKPQDRYQTPDELVADIDKVETAATSINVDLLRSLTEEHVEEAEEDEASRRSGDSRVTPESLPQSTSRRAKLPKSPPPRATKGTSRTPEAIPQPEPHVSKKWKQFSRNEPEKKSAPTAGGSGRASGGSDTGIEEHVSRKLPQRSLKGKGKGQPHVRIDLDFARIAVVGIIVAGVIGGFWWALSRGAGETDLHSTSPVTVEQPNPSAPLPLNPNPAPGVEQPPPGPSHVVTNAQVIDRSGPPFPGTDDLPGPTSTQVRDLVPDWVYVSRLPSAENVRPVVVTPTQGADSSSPLAAALASGTGPERVIELKGDGNYLLAPAVVKGAERVMIRAAAGRPLVVITGAPEAGAPAHVALDGGALLLDGVDILIPRSTGAARQTLFQVAGGTIVLKNCTVTVPERAGKVTLCRVAGTGASRQPARVLLETCLVRGNQLTAVEVIAPRFDVIAGGSLLASASGPLFDLQLAPPAAESSATEQKSPSRLRLLESTILSGGPGIELEDLASGNQENLNVQCRRSILAAAGTMQPTLLALKSWPLRATNLSGGSRASGLNWRQEVTLLSGWTTLISAAGPTGAIQIVDAGEWKSFWGTTTEGNENATSSEALSPDAPLTATPAIREQLARLVPAEVSQGFAVGADKQLHDPPQEAIERFLLLDGRPRLPPGVRELAPPSQVVTFDLRADKERLNNLLNGPQVPDGAHVRLTGFGIRDLPPLRLKGKSLRLEFVQEGGDAPLTIRPATTGEAAIIVDAGRLDLINGRFEYTTSKGKSPRLLLVKRGDFSLRDCLVAGPLRDDDAPDVPLIDWTGRADQREHAYISNSYLVGSSAVLSAAIDARLLVVHNSILASKTDPVAIAAGGKGGDPAREGWFVMDHCTIVGGSGGVRASGAPAGTQPGARILTTECVWAPAFGGDPNAFVFLRHPAGMSRSNLLDWWDVHSGYAAAIRSYRAEPESSTTTQDFAKDWATFWGPGHVAQPVAQSTAVLFANTPRSLQEAAIPDFALAAGSASARAAADGGPLGARVEDVGPPTVVPGGVPAPPRPNAPGRSSAIRPDF